MGRDAGGDEVELEPRLNGLALLAPLADGAEDVVEQAEPAVDLGGGGHAAQAESPVDLKAVEGVVD